MNISAIASAVTAPFKNIKNTVFKGRLNNQSDSFERTTPAKGHRRNRSIKTIEKVYAPKIEKEIQQQRQIKEKYSALDSRAYQLISGIISTVTSKGTGLNWLKAEISNPNNPLEIRQSYAERYQRKATQLRIMLAELESITELIDEFHTSGKTGRANIPDLRINLSPENIEYYEEQADFDPYSLIEE